MKCEEFRNLIQKTEVEMEEVGIAHAETCGLCQKWLEKGIEAAPVGFLPQKWDEPSPDLGRKVFPTESTSFVDRWWEKLFAGLGFAAALAVLSLLAFRFHFQFLPKPTITIGKSQTYSFLSEEPTLNEIQFLEPLLKEDEGNGVDLKLEPWSFLEPDAPLSFMDDESEEES